MSEQQTDAVKPAPRPPLDGIRVIDLTSVLMGPWACQILGDYGADVIKVESPGGDSTRRVGAARNPGMSAFYLTMNRNKRSVVLDLKSADGKSAMMALVRTADVLVYNVRPQAMRRLGLSFETLRAVNPRLIHVGAVGFGEKGPYAGRPALDDLIQGLAALPSLTANASGGEPRYLPVTIADRTVALQVVNAILAALFERERSGEGQAIEVPMFETMVQYVLGDHLQGHAFRPPLGPMGYDRLLVKERRPYATRDGHICVVVYTDNHWQAFCHLIGKPDMWETDPRLRDIGRRTTHIDELYALVAEAMLMRTTAEWLRVLEAADIPAYPMHTLESLLEDPHLLAAGFFETVEHPTEGQLLNMAIPGSWSRAGPTIRRHAPSLGENSREVLEELDLDPAQVERLLALQSATSPKAAKTLTRYV
jgi:crotonobetainyl-CoA:carnitine CoA-transferase CaiB-like acyl-CoA transferase